MTLGLGQTRVRAKLRRVIGAQTCACVRTRRPRGVIFSTRKVAARENKSILTRWLCWFGGSVLVVSIPSALGVQLLVVGYCTAVPVWLSWLAAHSPVHMDTDGWASIEDLTRLSQVKDSHYSVIAERLLTKTP